MSAHILIEKTREPHVGRIVINRPDAGNAITAAMVEEFRDAIETLERDDDIKVIVIAGVGDDLTVGSDVEEIAARYQPPVEGVRAKPLNQRARLKVADGWWGPQGLFKRVLHCRKITILAAKGACLEAGLYLSLYCDLTVAASTARFGNPLWQHIGVNGDVSMLIAAVGLKRAKELIYCGAEWSAQDAVSFGLIDQVAAPADHETVIADLARSCAMIMRDAIASEKQVVSASLAKMQIDTGMAAGAVLGGWATNIHFREGEFNLLREAKRRGVRAALEAGRDHFKA